MWGALAWHQHRDASPTGHWFLAVIGSDLKDSQWVHAGPANAIHRVDPRRIRLLHCNRDVYLDRLVRDLFEAIGLLESDIRDGKLSLRGECVNQERSKDWVMSTAIVVVLRADSPAAPESDGVAPAR
jgi:hypothetical protein